MIPNEQSVLYIFSGLPGSGKSTLAQRLARKMGCIYLRIDTIEQAIRDLLSSPVEGEGYRLAYRVAADNLRIGISVVADSCNPIALTRTEWEDVARHNGARPLNIEICCCDRVEHKSRIETRTSDVQGLKLPTWPEVELREYEPWTKERLIVDTSSKTINESFEQLYNVLQNAEQSCPPNSHAFGTFGTSAAEQPLVPKASGSR